MYNELSIIRFTDYPSSSVESHTCIQKKKKQLVTDFFLNKFYK